MYCIDPDAWASTHGSTDIERDGHRIEVVIEKRPVLLVRSTVVNNGLGGFALGFPRSVTVS